MPARDVCPFQHRRSERSSMPSLLDSPDAAGNTQEMDTSASQGSNNGDGAGKEEQRSRRQFRRNASRTKQGGGASGTAVVAKPNADSQGERMSLNKLMLKAILKTHLTMRDLSSTAWDTLLGKTSSSKVENMEKQTRAYAERVRQEGRGHTRDPPFV